MLLVLVPLLSMAGESDPLELPFGVHTPCATPEHWRPVAPLVRPPPHHGIDRLERDPYGTPNVQLSEHFAVRWGNRDNVSPVEVTALIEAFEDAWAVEIGEMAHVPPLGTDEYYFNVYIGDTGDGAPPGYGSGGYYSTDTEGWPVIVVSRNTLYNEPYADITAAHEFYHAVQGAAERYTYDANRVGAWFWEATATWASAEVYPDNPNHAVFLFGYALLPHKRVDFFDYPDEGLLQEYYQYGAFLWPLHLSDRTGGFEVIRDAWTDPGDDPDPLEVMRGVLAERGEDLDALWIDHAARNVVWDYPNRAIYLQLMQRARDRFPAEAGNLTAAQIPTAGTEDWVDGPDAVAIERYGSNTLTMRLPQEGAYTFEVEGDLTGSTGDPASFAGYIIVESDGRPRFIPLEFDADNRASIVLDDLGGSIRAHLLVGAWTSARVSPLVPETFPYRYRVSLDDGSPELPNDPDPGVVDDEAVAGCGCQSAPGPGLGATVALLGLAALRRRRRRSRG